MQRLENTLVLLLLVIASKGNAIAVSDALLVVTFLLSAYIFRQKMTPIPRFLYWLVGGYAVLTGIYFLKFGEINFTSSMRFLLKMMTGVLSVLALGNYLFLRFERYMRFFAATSLVFFSIQLIDYSTLKQLVGLLEKVIPALDYREDWYVNNFLFTLNDNAPTRNSGMAWEPKGYANLLLLALIIQLLISKLKMNRYSYLYIVALLSTQSTTALVVLATAIPAIFVYNAHLQYRVLALFGGLAVCALVFSLDIVGPKIQREFEESEAHLIYIEAETDQKAITLGRFGSWKLAMMDLPKNPLVGIGMQDKFRTEGEHTHLVYVNGLADYLSRFGILGMVFLGYCYVKSTRSLFQRYRVRGWFFFFITIISIFFASAIVINPLYFALQFFFLLPDTAKRPVKGLNVPKPGAAGAIV
ncbi:MAG: O-antigen ligase family protein [Flavobacteriales bacterium]